MMNVIDRLYSYFDGAYCRLSKIGLEDKQEVLANPDFQGYKRIQMFNVFSMQLNSRLWPWRRLITFMKLAILHVQYVRQSYLILIRLLFY